MLNQTKVTQPTPTPNVQPSFILCTNDEVVVSTGFGQCFGIIGEYVNVNAQVAEIHYYVAQFGWMKGDFGIEDVQPFAQALNAEHAN